MAAGIRALRAFTIELLCAKAAGGMFTVWVNLYNEDATINLILTVPADSAEAAEEAARLKICALGTDLLETFGAPGSLSGDEAWEAPAPCVQ